MCNLFIVDCSSDDWNDLTDVDLVASSRWSSSYDVENIKRPDSECWHSGDQNSQWITFEFPNPVAITGVRYKADDSWDSIFKNFTFEYSNDGGATWESFHQGQGVNLECCEWEEVNLTMSPTAEDFRLYMIDSWKNSWFTIEQLQLKTCGGKNNST